MAGYRRRSRFRWLTQPLPWAVVIALVASSLVVVPQASAESPYRILVSPFADRSQAVPLDEQNVSGRIHVFTMPEEGVSRVVFYLNDPERSGTPFQVERHAPYDFAGTGPGKTALPFDTATLNDGTHTITAAVERSDGVTDVLHGTFFVANATPALVFSVEALTFTAEAGGTPPSRTTHVATNDDTVTEFTLTADKPWVSLTPQSTTTPAGVGVQVDATGLSPGAHEATITAEAQGYVSDRAFVTLWVSEYSTLVSLSPDRSDPTTLAGRTLEGDIYAFTFPEEGIKRVLFYVNDPDRTGSPYQIERQVPYDLAGTAPDKSAFPFDTTSLPDGRHTVTAAVERSDGVTEVIHSRFTVHNADPAMFADPASLSYQATVGGSAAPRAVEIGTTDGSPAAFTATTDASWLSVSPESGTTPEAVTVSVSSAGLAAGTYHASVTVSASEYDAAVIPVTFDVQPGRCGPLDCAQLLVELPYELEFDDDAEKVLDGNGVGTGFTYVDPPSKGTGYIPENLEVDLDTEALKVTTTAGLAFRATNSQDNALGVGIRPPNQISVISTTLSDPPAGTASFEQAGLWFGNDEDNHVKLVVLSRPGGTIIEFLMEVGGWDTARAATTFLDLTGADVELILRVNPVHKTIQASYSVNGADPVVVGTFNPPNEFFSFDAARIDPTIGTDSFAGIFASHRNASAPLVYTFDRFAVVGEPLPPAPFVEFPFLRKHHHAATHPTAMLWGPDGRLYVTEVFGKLRVITFDDDWNILANQSYSPIGDRLTLGLTLDPASTPDDVILWVSHSNPSFFEGEPNSSMVSRLSGPGFAVREDVITGLPRAKANHAVNHIHFGPDGLLYIASGGNTGAGAPNDADSEFGDMEEQPLSAALLVADVFDPDFDGDCHNPDDIFGSPPCDVAVWASGLRNMYDFAWHSNGNLYGPDNGLGVTGTFPPSPEPPCTGKGDPASYLEGGHNPGPQPDFLHLLEQGNYYGHPNPHRDECVFFDGSWQGVAPMPNYTEPIADLGDNKSANGTIEYLSDRFQGRLKGQLVISNYSVGDDLTRVELSEDGRSVVHHEQLACCFGDPLPIVEGPDGVIFIGEFGWHRITVLIPDDDLGSWETKAPMPEQLLDAFGVAVGGKLYAVAGKTADGPQATLYVYDPATDSWTAGPDMPGVAVEDVAVAAHDGKVYAFGGSTGPFDGPVSQSAVYDPLTETWTELPPMPTPRGGAKAAAVDGLLYVAGGRDADGASVDTVEIFDPSTNTWSTGTPMLVRRDNAAAAAVDGKLYMIGGRTREASGAAVDQLNSVEMYDPSTGAWTERAPMPTARRAMIAEVIDGRILVVGGERAPDGSAFDVNEEYNPVLNQWTRRAPITTGRHGPAAGVIDGVLYVAGGGAISGSFFSDVTEAFSFGSGP